MVSNSGIALVYEQNNRGTTNAEYAGKTAAENAENEAFSASSASLASAYSAFVVEAGMTLSNDSDVTPDAHRAEPDVDVAKGDGEQAHPREQHMPPVQRAAPGVHALPHRPPREAVEIAADHVAKRVAA